MRYTIAYITGGIIAFIAICFLLKALVGVADVGADIPEQFTLMYAMTGAALLVAAVQFVLMGHLLTEVRNLHLPNRERENELPQANYDPLRLWEVTGIDKSSGFETTVKIRAENKAKAGICALASELSTVNTITDLGS